jgi:hypothetical protein
MKPIKPMWTAIKKVVCKKCNTLRDVGCDCPLCGSIEIEVSKLGFRYGSDGSRMMFQRKRGGPSSSRDVDVDANGRKDED